MFPTHDLLSILFYQRNCGTEKVCQFAILLNIETALKIVECENEREKWNKNNVKGLTNNLHTLSTASKPQDQRNDKKVMAAKSYHQLHSLERSKASSDQSEFAFISEMDSFNIIMSWSPLSEQIGQYLSVYCLSKLPP